MSGGFRGCSFCGAHGPCYDDCDCAKCLDPIDYEEWRTNSPEEYDDWIEDQHLGHGDECDCPSCA